MDEDELAAKMHFVFISESGSDNSEDGNSDFDEDYEALKPPPISLKDRQQDIVKIRAFKIVSYKNNVLKNAYPKLNARNRKPKRVPASKFQKKTKSNFKNPRSSHYSKQKLEKSKVRSIKSVDANGETKERECSLPLNSHLPLCLKSKTEERNRKKLNADAVKSHIHDTLVSPKCGDKLEIPIIDLIEEKNCVKKKSRPKRKKIKAGGKNISIEPNNSAALISDISNNNRQENKSTGLHLTNNINLNKAEAIEKTLSLNNLSTYKKSAHIGKVKRKPVMTNTQLDNCGTTFRKQTVFII